MATDKRKAEFYASDDGKWCQQTLINMEKDSDFYSEPSFTADTDHYPDNEMSFVMTHMNYLMNHPEINPRQYISNLRLRSRISTR